MSKEPEHFRAPPRPVTVAAIQMACDWDARRQHRARRAAGARGRRARRADHPAAGAVRDAVLLHRAGRAPPDARPAGGREPRGAPLRAASRASSAWCCRSASSSAPDLPSSTPSRSSMRTARNLGVYRKSHIPNGPGYQEKNYFSPGDTGFKVWDDALRAHRRRHLLGPVVSRRPRASWRCMGAELFLFPTAIGSEPPPALPVNSREHWQRTQQGHAAANLTPLIASNRYGLERSLQDPEGLYIRFYGSSFIADPMGAKVAEAGEEGDAVLTAHLRSGRDGAAAQQLVRVPRPPAGSVRAAGVARRQAPQRRLRLSVSRARAAAPRVRPPGAAPGRRSLRLARLRIARDRCSACDTASGDRRRMRRARCR